MPKKEEMFVEEEGSERRKSWESKASKKDSDSKIALGKLTEALLQQGKEPGHEDQDSG